MSIHTIPDNCMVNILLRVPLPDRVRTGQVCSRWRWLRSVVTARLNSLTILVGPNASKLIASSKFNYTSYTYDHIRNDDGTRMFKPKVLSKWNLLQFDSLDTKTVLGLAALFPNIGNLTIALDEVDYAVLLSAATLFIFNAAKLVTLKMFCRLTEKRYVPQYVSKHFFDAINSLSSLRCLTLEFDNNFALTHHHAFQILFAVNTETTTVDLPVIGQLDEFNFYSTDDDRGDVMFDSFQRYAQHSQRPLRIQYGYKTQYREISKLAQLNPQFCRRFTRFVSFDGDPISAEHDLFTLCAHFTSVTSVWINVENITIRNFTKNISKLTNLIHLTMSIWCSRILPAESNDQIMLQSPSVKALELAFKPTNHDNICQFNIPWTFPNVQAIHLYIFDDSGCDICGYERMVLDEPNDIPVDRLKLCFDQILSNIQIHLSQCSQLRTITEVIADPFEAINTPITRQNLMNKIELTVESQ